MTIYVNCSTVWGLVYTTYYIISLASGYTVSKDRPSLQGASAQWRRVLLRAQECRPAGVIVW